MSMIEYGNPGGSPRRAHLERRATDEPAGRAGTVLNTTPPPSTRWTPSPPGPLSKNAIAVRSVTVISTVFGHDRDTSTVAMPGIAATRSRISSVLSRSSGLSIGTAATARIWSAVTVREPLTATSFAPSIELKNSR